MNKPIIASGTNAEKESILGDVIVAGVGAIGAITGGVIGGVAGAAAGSAIGGPAGAAAGAGAGAVIGSATGGTIAGDIAKSTPISKMDTPLPLKDEEKDEET